MAEFWNPQPYQLLDFPQSDSASRHDLTGDRFFNAGQFDAYQTLGYFLGQKAALQPAAAIGKLPLPQPPKRSRLRRQLRLSSCASPNGNVATTAVAWNKLGIQMDIPLFSREESVPRRHQPVSSATVSGAGAPGRQSPSGTPVRAENLIRGSDQHSCSYGAVPVMITTHVPAVRFPPHHATSRVAAASPAQEAWKTAEILILRHQVAVLQRGRAAQS